MFKIKLSFTIIRTSQTIFTVHKFMRFVCSPEYRSIFFDNQNYRYHSNKTLPLDCMHIGILALNFKVNLNLTDQVQYFNIKINLSSSSTAPLHA